MDVGEYLAAFPSEQEYIYGEDIGEQVESYLAENGLSRPFFVVGGTSFQASGAKDDLGHLAANMYVQLAPNPKLENVSTAINLFEATNSDCIIAVGGGSCIDTAKGMSYGLARNGDLYAAVLEGQEPTQDGVPLVAVPTTAGSGSESTHFAVLYVDGVKYSLADDSLLPQAVVFNPEYTHSLPAKQTATGGADVVMQAIESAWSNQSTEESMEYGLQALTMAMHALPLAVQNPTPLSRRFMLIASNLAGRAINISKTTVCHALSYHATAGKGVPHGEAVSLFGPASFLYNADVDESSSTHPLGAAHTQKVMGRIMNIFGSRTPQDSATYLHNFFSGIGLAGSLAEVGYSSHDADSLVEAVNVQRLANNPREIGIEGLHGIVSASL